MNLFKLGQNLAIQGAVIDMLNTNGAALGLNPRSSPRSVGDGIQDYLAQHLLDILPKELRSNYTGEFARRAMADVAFEDSARNYYVVDIKTHCLSTKFNMPNLVSVERLSRFYEEPTNYFSIMYVSYELRGANWVFTECKFIPIEYLDWSCLTIGALGWGQIQIANANVISVRPQSRRQWMIELCNVMLDFYPREIGKIQNRVSHFEIIRERWLSKSEE
jgi:hypothetical protein